MTFVLVPCLSLFSVSVQELSACFSLRPEKATVKKKNKSGSSLIYGNCKPFSLTSQACRFIEHSSLMVPWVYLHDDQLPKGQWKPFHHLCLELNLTQSASVKNQGSFLIMQSRYVALMYVFLSLKCMSWNEWDHMYRQTIFVYTHANWNVSLYWCWLGLGSPIVCLQEGWCLSIGSMSSQRWCLCGSCQMELLLECGQGAGVPAQVSFASFIRSEATVFLYWKLMKVWFFFSLFFLCLSLSIQSFVLLLSGHLGADNVAYTCVGSAPYPDDILVCRIYWKLPAKRSCNSEWSAPLIQAWTEISALDVLPLCCFHHVCLRAGRIWLNHSTPPLMCKRGSSLKFHISCIFHVVWVIMFTHPEGWRKQRAEIAVYAFQNSLWKAA